MLNILHQYEYTGALVGRKRYKASLHEKRTIPQDKADWIIYEGAHDAIVSKVDFDRAQEVIRQRPRRASGPGVPAERASQRRQLPQDTEPHP